MGISATSNTNTSATPKPTGANDSTSSETSNAKTGDNSDIRLHLVLIIGGIGICFGIDT